MDTTPHRRTALRILMLATFVAASLLSRAVAVLPPASGTDTIVHNDSAEQRAMAEWALGRYQAAGLEFPPLVIEFAGRDLARCDGAPGRTYLDETTAVVKMCWNARFILLHELAHVWASHNLPAAKHEPFMAMRADAISWASSEVAWAQRGSEHAANVIAWGVLEDPFPISRTYPNDPDALRDAFVFLTGIEPLHNGGPDIEEPDREFFSPERTNPPLESGR
jgi:hypothetical protein